MKKGIYLVSEPGVMNPKSGAYKHIKIGIQELSKYYDIKYIGPDVLVSQKSSGLSIIDQNKFRGLLRDVKIFMKNIISFLSLLKRIKKESPDFIYERASFINFQGLVIAKLLGIKHFYEVNGVFSEGQKNYYLSYSTKIAYLMEKSFYKYSNFNFFVGTYGDVYKLKSKNWINIENGIEEKSMIAHHDLKKEDSDRLNIVFVGKVMRHQKINILHQAISLLNINKDVTLHFIGEGFDSLKVDNQYIEVNYYPFLDREELSDILKDMHIGLIAGSPNYQSAMKLYDYALGKCVVIAPNIYNFKYWFKDELVFFKSEDSISMAKELSSVINHFDTYEQFGELLFNKVKEEFTWEKIYNNVCMKMEANL